MLLQSHEWRNTDISMADWTGIAYRTMYLSILLHQYPLFFILKHSLPSLLDPLCPWHAWMSYYEGYTCDPVYRFEQYGADCLEEVTF
jgi:hypothetical protein